MDHECDSRADLSVVAGGGCNQLLCQLLRCERRGCSGPFAVSGNCAAVFFGAPGCAVSVALDGVVENIRGQILIEAINKLPETADVAAVELEPQAWQVP